MNKFIFEQYTDILNEYYFPNDYLAGTHNGWNVYYLKKNNVGYDGKTYSTHIHMRMADKTRGNNFCTMADFYTKITKFINEFDNPGAFNIKAKENLDKALSSYGQAFVLFRFKDKNSGIDVPTHVIIREVPDYILNNTKKPETGEPIPKTLVKDILISSIYRGIPLKRITYAASIQLKEQYEILNDEETLSCYYQIVYQE